MNINQLNKTVTIFADTGENIWTDPYVAQQMLAAHLNEQADGATRNKSFVEKSLKWLNEEFPAVDYPKILDLGCGPGIYAEKFLRAGYQVTGLDFSRTSIDYARQSAEEKGLEIDYICADYLMADWQEGRYDLIFMIYCDLGVLSHEGRKLILQKAAQALNPGGKLIFDVFTPEKYKEFTPTQTWQIEENSFWSAEPCLHLQRSKQYGRTYLDAHHLLYEQNQKTFYIWETVFTPEEVIEELRAEGFTKIEVYSNLAGDLWEADSDTACFVSAIK
ncbi:methyltransferase domain-containing protein [Enterococcus sp. 669A]|uniref:Methyltransferase domain-containing protein n=1 Tax=Candidatus Enterococcus moelleringii TaxID=2815325 RepID=A0ABS3LEK9_9ENTE|nr:class I SAM-dependent methyltransferase [Enterococcus sp. 669A]MBO1308078.1 methyltransferase domain-containing protein [Enterococcus sp. 669A]